MGKRAKEHRKKVAKRNENLKQQKRKIEKVQRDFLMQLIEKEKQSGAFNSPTLPPPTFGVPSSDNPSLGLPTGPQI